MANVATLVAGTTRKQHLDCILDWTESESVTWNFIADPHRKTFPFLLALALALRLALVLGLNRLENPQ